MAEHETKASKGGRHHCPHLGLSIDRSVMLLEATPAHRCYAPGATFEPETDYQQHYCLTRDHIQCRFYTEPVPQARPLAPPPSLPKAAQFPPPSLSSLTSSLSAGSSNLRRWLPLLAGGTLGIVLLLLLVTFLPGLLGLRAADNPVALPPMVATGVDTDVPVLALNPALTETFITTPAPMTPTVAAELVLLPTPTPTPPLDAGGQTTLLTPEPGGAVFELAPSIGNVGWWSSADERRSHLNDSFLYAGALQADTYVSAIRFDLQKIPRGAEIRQLELRLTGLRQDRLAQAANAIWWVELIPEKELTALGGSSFMSIFSAPSSITLPPVRAAELAAGEVNVWEMDELTRTWLAQQLVDGAQSLIVRIKAVTENVDTLFAWDSGFGAESQGNAPKLIVNLGPPPATPPPTPTRGDILVATFTPLPPLEVVVAQNATATEVARTTGTYTPEPFVLVWTPTAFPANLETVQAIVSMNNLTPVVLHTPVPANQETATFVAVLATAVAQTTGTYTPVPIGYVTPILILPSPPPENLLTAVARETQAAAAIQTATSTPLPYNAVFANYVIATPTPKGVQTAAVMVAQATRDAETTGTPTSTPWNQIVLTPTPEPVTPESPTPTATKIVALYETPTPAPTALIIPTIDRVPDELRGKIIFRSSRGASGLFAADLATNTLLVINDERIYTLAQPQLPLSPDGQFVAFVEEDRNRLFQIKIRSLVYGDIKQLTAFNPNPQMAAPTSYDPAWSPRGDLIAFVTNNTGNDEIWTTNIEGGILTQLTFNHTEWDKHPSWSPDGSQIVFFSNRDIGLRRLWVMNADGSGQREISSLFAPPDTPYEDWDPIWIR